MKWTKEMDDFILKYYTRRGPVAVAKRLGVSIEETAKRATWLGATKRRDELLLYGLSGIDIKILKLKESLNIGDKVANKTVIGLYPHYILLNNGRYKETLYWDEAVNFSFKQREKIKIKNKDKHEGILTVNKTK